MTFRKPSHSLRTSLSRDSRSHSEGAALPKPGRPLGGKRRSAKRRDEKRRSLLESLESRQLLAGPELIGIQPNEGDLLFNGDTLNFSPKELTFRFDDNTQIDESTLSAIRITRAGEDQTFESASVTSDLGTNGLALVEFRARQSGSLGNGIELEFTASNRNTGSAPVITVEDRVVTIDVNINPLQTTLVRDLTAALNSDPDASALVEAIQVSGSSGQRVGNASLDGTSLVLDGANAAQAVTDFGTDGDVRVRLISTLPGVDGRGTNIIVGRQNFGGPANPTVVVTDQTIRVQLNSYFADPSTAQDFVNALTASPQASALIKASVQEGEADTVIGSLPTSYSPINLSGVSDVVVEPGFVGLGDSPREVIFRFSEPLPDDIYQIDVLGSGALALRGEDGEAFQDGEDLTQIFNINLGPRVVAVVPEPVRRRADGTLSNEAGKIEVHFNDDDLLQSAAQNEDFYQLIFTRDTVDNTDDVVIRLDPGAVTYSNITNIATLDFKRPLSRIPDPDNPGELLRGSARLRIGTSEDLPIEPQEISLPPGTTAAPDGAGDSFDTAYDLNSTWSLSGATTTRSATLESEIQNERPYELDLPGPDVPGTRTIRADDPSRLDRVVPLDYVRQFADTIDGISTIEYDFVSSWLGDDPNRPGIIADTNYFNIISEVQKQRVREVMSLYSEYLGVSFVEVSDRDPSDIGGFSIAVGDLYGGDEREASSQGGLAVVTRDRDNDGVDDLVVMDFQDFDESIDDQFGGEFFRGAMFGVGQLLGYGYADDLPQPVTQSTSFIFQPGTDNEPAFPSYADIIHGQYLYRPDSTDIDMYRFTIDQPGSVAIETIAERLSSPSLLDTQLRLYQQDASGNFHEIAQNDDYFSNDSLIRVTDLVPGVYMIGVSAKGNDSYDPTIPGTGFGGLSQGGYELRVDFTPAAVNSLVDNTGVALDGDGDGRPGGTFNYWFKPSDPSETLYVDKGNVALRQATGAIPSNLGDLAFISAFQTRTIGYLNNPYTEIDRVLADVGRISELKQEAENGTLFALNQLRQSSDPADIQRAQNITSYLTGLQLTVRVLGNGGLDGLVQTPGDNFSYNIGFNNNGLPLEDGSSLNLPADVQMMIDSGAILKLSNARIGVGSVAPSIDLSGSNLQVLGTPSIVTAGGLPARDATGAIVPGSVFLTSVNDNSVGTGNQIGFLPSPQAGDWGGIDFRGDLDAADELRENLEDEGVFNNHIQFADIRYGGGPVSVGGRDVVISPIDMAITRPTIINSTISESADAAIAATPDTFREDRFTDPRYQEAGRFTPDYSRVGPEIHGNSVIENSVNGLFIRLRTRSGDELETVSTATRFDDSDITHVLTENLVITGTPGGPIVQSGAPSSFLIRLSERPADGAVPVGTYVYRLTNVNETGIESAASDPTVSITTGGVGGIRLQQLPTGEPDSGTVARRLYRAEVVGGVTGTFELVAQLNASSTTYTDRAAEGAAPLQDTASPLRSRLDASLVIDPSTVLKVDAARIEARFGANLIAEGDSGNPVVITSIEDQRYGAGGTFDTNGRGNAAELTPGDWGGIYIGHGSTASIDNAVIAGGGGTTRIEGGFASFNAIEVHQGDLRLTNSRIEHNADGRGVLNDTRVGRGDNASGAVFVRAATPVIIDNDFIDNDAAAITVDVNSLNSQEVFDRGRSTGTIGRFDVVGNSGALIEDNSLTRNAVNGLAVRGGQLVTEGVWDDIDIVHVVTETIEIPNQHIYGGLRLVSDARGSLVVKFQTQEGEEETNPAGIVVGGSLLTAADEFRDIADRIGGSLQLIGHPDFPVVMTAISDDFVGAGFTIDGFAQVDTDNDGVISGVITGDDDDDDTTGGGFVGTLPTGPEVNLGNLIDNDVAPSITGSFAATISDANEILIDDDVVTVNSSATGQQLIGENYIFSYSTYLTTGNQSTALAATTITQPATLIADDRVESRGTYAGPNGDVNWIATSYFINGLAVLFSTLELESSTTLGDISVVSYLDEDVQNVSDDVLYTVGTPGQSDFRVYTVDSALRVGFSHGGYYVNDGINQINATYEGWAADQYNDLEQQIIAGTQNYSIPGVIDLASLPAGTDPVFGQVYGPGDVTTAHSWRVNSNASSSTVTSFLELLASDPSQEGQGGQIQPGQWDGVTIREGASDRNVAAAAEQEPVRTTVFDTNSFPGQSQFLGELAPDEQSGDENRRLGFIVDGAITTRDDLDVYTFIAESNTEVWLDIDRTSTNLDTVIELIDFNGEILASSNDSLLAELDPSTGLYISPRLDSDAAQPLTVNEERLPVQRITVDNEIVNANGGSLVLGLDSGSSATVSIPYDVFNANPAGSIADALNSTFSSQLGFVTTRLIAGSDTQDFVVEVNFDAAFFTGLVVPEIIGTSNPIFPSIDPMQFETDIVDSVLQDTFSYNAKDAGMRIRLPGEAGTRNQYHIRVRSSNTPDPTDLDTLVNGDVLGGLTRGRYTMQIRLGETDETAGTQVRLTDIRYATNGLQIIGQPLHSPLTGEEAETTASNDTASDAQRLGYYGVGDDVGTEAGPLQSDRLAKSFAGEIDSATDVDWYQFEIQYENLTRDGEPLLLSTIIDLDYASNFARSDMAFYIFNAAGDLIYTATDSNVANDLPASRNDNSSDDLSRGGAGTEDPFLGSVELVEGTYYIAVSNQTQVPNALDQFFEPASNHPLVRLEPISAIDRIAQDNMSNRVLFDEGSIVPYSLDDVVLYVNTSTGLNVVNPFTGENYGQVGTFGSDDIYDVAFRSNGELYAYTGFGTRVRSDSTWFYVQLDTGNAGLTQISTGAGITTYGDVVVEQNNTPQILDVVANEGIFVEALSIREYKNFERGLFVGSRPTLNGSAGLEYRDNILYEFSPDTGLAVGPSFNLFLANSGAGTIPREIGQIDTTAPASARSTELGVSDVVEIVRAGVLQQQIFDGDNFTITAGVDTTTFEFDFNGQVTVTGAPILDGDTLAIGSNIFEFDTGSRLRLADVSANGGLDVGQSVTVSAPGIGSQRFEFVNQGGTPAAGSIPINIRFANGQARSATQIASELALAISSNLPGVIPTLIANEVAFNSGTTFTFAGAGMSRVGADGVAAGNNPILVDESFTATESFDAIIAALSAQSIPFVTNGVSFTVPTAGSVDVLSSGLIGGGSPGVNVGRVPILLNLDDTSDEVAQKVADAINNLGSSVTAVANDRSVRINNGFIAGASGNLVAGGVPTGGTITGVEILGNDVYAISDAGGLFRITDAELTAGGSQFLNGNRTIGSYVESATDLLRVSESASFTGLRAGPNSVDGGVYSNILFGITSAGDIYAFNTEGELQPFFAGGQSMISTGIPNAEGLDFSTLDYNLWHFTGARSDDPGHGMGVAAGQSLAFTYEDSFRTNYDSPAEYPTDVARRDGQGVNRTYNFPGGAKGEVISNTFSLENYSPSDVPVLYFNYLISADGGGNTDSLRVYVIQPDGTEHALALNTTARGIGAFDDEFDDPPQSAPYNDVIDVDKQQLFDNTDTWRQARVSLAEFAGQGDLSLRVEFSTSGTMDVGTASIRTVPASDLAEGQTIRINNEIFTINFPPTLIATAGGEIAVAYAADPNTRAEFTLDGAVYVLDDGTRTIAPTEVAIDLTANLGSGETISDLTASDIALLIDQAVSLTPPPLTNYDIRVAGNSIEFGQATDLTSTSPTLVTVRNTTASGSNLIEVRASMTAEQVAFAVQDALEQRFLGDLVGVNSPDYLRTSGATVSLPGFSVLDAGPFANTSQRYADQFGATPVAGSRDNDFEGIFLDDFIIGLAERGERVTDPRPAGSSVDTPFVEDLRYTFPQPDIPVSDLVTGSYQIEIRDGSEYVNSAAWIDEIRNGQFRSFDSNVQLSDAMSIEARNAAELVDGQSFSITDGRAIVEFEFDSDGAVTPGRVRIPFSLEVFDQDNGLLRPQNATEVAASIIQAINRSDVRSVLDVQAVPSSGFESEVVSSPGVKQVFRVDPRINLVGDVVVSDPSGSLASVERSELRGDSNRDRDAQGVIMVENSRFLFNEGYGINISHDTSTEVAGNDTPSVVRYPRNLIELNTERFVSGVVVQSNIIAFNTAGGIQIEAIDGAADETSLDSVPIERIVNNTIIGGTITSGTSAPSETFVGILFEQGRISFADAVVDYSPDAGGAPPTLAHQTPDAALGIPDCEGRGLEPTDGQFTVSLGLEGSLTLQFTDNFLTGSGDQSGDLVVFETGEIESVMVEISRDGVTFFNVGSVGGLTNQIDIDQFGFGPNDRFAFVRLTDMRQGSLTGSSLGADIDAVGAISSVPVDQYNAGGVGVNIVGDSSPTVLNNVISNTETGVSVTGDNAGFVSGGNSYYRNTNDTAQGVQLGTLPQLLSPAEAVFVDPARFVFSPASGSRIIDSSIDSLPDRSSLTTVRNAIGISPSPVLAPRLDVNGQTRVDDPNVEPPSGLGERIFKDRGGFDRGDLEGPRVTLLQPLAPGIGLDAGRATVIGTRPQAFEIQLIDGLPPADIVPGTGIDDGSVSTSSLILLKDGVALVEGIDYRFAYNPTTNVIRLTPIAGAWEDDSTYVIRMIDSSDAIIQAGDGVVYSDGATLRVVDELNQPTTFEYETGLLIDMLAGLTSASADGITFTVYDGSTTRTFELDANNAILPGSIGVDIPEAGDTADFAAALAATINADTSTNFTARASGETVQLVGGTPLSTVTTNSGSVQISGSIGTDTGFGVEIPVIPQSNIADVADGQSFIVRIGAATQVVFEFDTNNSLSNSGATAVTIPSNATLDQVANAIVIAVGGSTLGLAPSNEGFGRVFLGGDANYSLDLSESSLTQIGLPGEVATVPIEIPIDQSAEEIAAIIQQAIDDQNLAGVSTSLVDVRVFLEGTGGVSGFGAVDTVVVQDQVGNLLQSNQADGRTELTIFIGTGFDYGDAPAPYISAMADGGPRHRIDPDLHLGTDVTADSDAQLPNADSGDDGLTLPSVFQAGFSEQIGIYVNNADAGQVGDQLVYVHAWFDWNQNGEFEASERYRFGTLGTGLTTIFSNTVSNVNIQVPPSALPGQTYARFRVSESPTTESIGTESTGEVEDYAITVATNPYQNPSNRFDANASGATTPLDALQIINAIARNLPPTPPFEIDLQFTPVTTPQYPDVNGDGLLTPGDALDVINELARIAAELSSGEGEQVARQFVSAGPGVLASTPTLIGDQYIVDSVTADDDEEESDDVQGPVSTVTPQESKASVFDSPAVMELDSIVDGLAEDAINVSGKSESAESGLDQFFASL